MEKTAPNAWGNIPKRVKEPDPVRPKTEKFLVRGETTTATYQRDFDMNWQGGRVRARSVGLRHSTPFTEVTREVGTGNIIEQRQLAPMVTYSARQHHRENGPWHAPTSNAPIADRRTTWRIQPGTVIGNDANGREHPIIGRRAR